MEGGETAPRPPRVPVNGLVTGALRLPVVDCREPIGPMGA